MPNEIIDLWPEDLVVADVTSPFALLWEQAEALSRRTKRRVEAEIQRQPLPGDRWAYGFSLKATALGGYTHTLFYAAHKKNEFYPVIIYKTINQDVKFAPEDAEPMYSCRNQQEFEEALRAIFSSEATRKTLDNLLPV